MDPTSTQGFSGSARDDMGIRAIGEYSLRLAIIVIGMSLAGSAFAQNPAASASPPDPDEGTDISGFHVTQTMELGGRISEVNGSQPMYNTLVNQQTGTRILDQSLTMKSLKPQNIFNTLTLNSFGWGGDPEQAARLRIAKWGWYNFSASYQYMQNYFDYNLFANPLNPPTASPFIPILTSPHSYYNRQNLYNFDLVVLPMHRISFRVDYNRNRISGPSFQSNSQSTERSPARTGPAH
jgi:hypothetical protein